ncbi:amidase [Plastoroseomonas arctica]|uniref:Amidase n=1 Tax=Plastoroseomonas arctica TaxID=1509237 RepID=A0AAF1JVD4_9PROT|nr:amidase [Plastoroseomonas arctica]MBR0654541.1 amidase [Plastoroseomonas arctica]
MTELTALCATELRRRMTTGEIATTEVLRAFRRRIERLNPDLNAFVEMSWDRAEAEAAAADARAPDLPPLFGLPVGVKESTDVEGLHTTFGSLLYKDRIAAADAPPIAAIRRAGGIIIGKTNVPELLQGGTSQNSIYGLTRNAHDARYSSSGSSGGTGTALASDMVPLATGSDMGGSIRGPAAAHGIAGLRPTPGLIAYPSLPLAFDVSSVVGPMARSTEDVMLLLAGMICSSHLDPFDWNPDPAPLLAPQMMDPKTLRIAVSRDLGCVKVTPAIRARFEEAIGAIAPHVDHVEWATPDLGDMTRAFYVLRTLAYLVTYGALHESEPGRLTAQKNVDLRRGFAASARMIAEAQRTQSLAFRSLATFLLGYDVLITPGASEPLAMVEDINRREAALAMDNTRYAMDEYDFSRMPKANINTPITWTAHPVATIPAGHGPDGLPFGLQLIGRYRDDIRLLRIALTLEAVLGGQPGFGRVRPALDVAA